MCTRSLQYHKSYDKYDLNFINISPAVLRFKTLNKCTLEVYSIRGKYVSLTPLRFHVLEPMMSHPFTRRHNTFTSRDRVEWKSEAPIERISSEILREIIADRNSLSVTHGSQPTVVNEAKISGAGKQGEKRTDRAKGLNKTTEMTRKKKRRAFATQARNFVRAIHENKRGLGGDVRANKIKTPDDALPIPRYTLQKRSSPLFFFPLLFSHRREPCGNVNIHPHRYVHARHSRLCDSHTDRSRFEFHDGVSLENDAAPRRNSTVFRVVVGRLHD